MKHGTGNNLSVIGSYFTEKGIEYRGIWENDNLAGNGKIVIKYRGCYL